MWLYKQAYSWQTWLTCKADKRYKKKNYRNIAVDLNLTKNFLRDKMHLFNSDSKFRILMERIQRKSQTSDFKNKNSEMFLRLQSYSQNSHFLAQISDLLKFLHFIYLWLILQFCACKSKGMSDFLLRIQGTDIHFWEKNETSKE